MRIFILEPNGIPFGSRKEENFHHKNNGLGKETETHFHEYALFTFTNKKEEPCE